MSGLSLFLQGWIVRPAWCLLLLAMLSTSLRAEDDDSDRKTSPSTDTQFALDNTKIRANSKRSTTQYRQAVSVVRTQDWPFRWEPEPGKPITRIEIRLSEQRIYIMQGSLVVGEGPVSTGRAGYETITGSFKVLVKEKLHYSNLYGELVDKSGRTVNASAEAGDPIPKGLSYKPSPMPYFLRISHSGTGLHEGWLPGYAASHGCIRLPRKMAPLLFEAVPVGCPVIIFPAEPAPAKVAKNNN